MQLQLSTWAETEAYLKDTVAIIIPIGSTEQHGPTGLIGTDALCAEVIAKGVGEATGERQVCRARERRGCVATPPKSPPQRCQRHKPGRVSSATSSHEKFLSKAHGNWINARLRSAETPSHSSGGEMSGVECILYD